MDSETEALFRLSDEVLQIISSTSREDLELIAFSGMMDQLSAIRCQDLEEIVRPELLEKCRVAAQRFSACLHEARLAKIARN